MITVHPDRIDCTTAAEVGWLRRHRCSLPAVLVRKRENPRRELLKPGMWKRCRKCSAAFQVLHRGDCRAVNCATCRAKPRSRAKIVVSPLAVVALADTCRCGARLDCGRCAECSGIGVWS